MAIFLLTARLSLLICCFMFAITLLMQIFLLTLFVLCKRQIFFLQTILDHGYTLRSLSNSPSHHVRNPTLQEYALAIAFTAVSVILCLLFHASVLLPPVVVVPLSLAGGFSVSIPLSRLVVFLPLPAPACVSHTVVFLLRCV